MKKATLIISVIILMSFVAMENNATGIPSFSDTTKPGPSAIESKKTDTLYVALFERSDSVKAVILYLSPDGNVKHITGRSIVRGIKLPNGQWANPNQLDVTLFDNKGVKIKYPVLDWFPAPKIDSVKTPKHK